VRAGAGAGKRGLAPSDGEKEGIAGWEGGKKLLGFTRKGEGARIWGQLREKGGRFV